MSKKMPAVVVVWGDAHASTDFEDNESCAEAHAPKIVTSIGWQWKRDKKGVTLVSDAAAEDYDRRLFIPAGMIQSVRRLVYRKRR